MKKEGFSRWGGLGFVCRNDDWSGEALVRYTKAGQDRSTELTIPGALLLAICRKFMADEHARSLKGSSKRGGLWRRLWR